MDEVRPNREAGGLDLVPWESETTLPWSPDKVVLISDWLTKDGGGVNTVIKDQIDFLGGVYRIPIDILMVGGHYEPAKPATLVFFPNAEDAPGIVELLRHHIVEPAARGLQIAVIIHNLLTIPYNQPLVQSLRQVIAEIQDAPPLAANIQFVAWTHDVFEVPHEMVPGVRYVAISEERRKLVAEYFRQPLSRIHVSSNAVNLRRLLSLTPETHWLWSTFQLGDDDFVAFYPVRMSRNKNIEAAIAIVAAMNRLGASTTLIVPGMTHDWQRDYYVELRERAAALGIPEKFICLTDVTFEGRRVEVTDEVIRDLYKLSSFLLFTSRDEGFGLPLVEAACYRLPAVVSNIPPLLELAQDTGTLVIDADGAPAEELGGQIMDYVRGLSVNRMQRRVFSTYNIAHQFERLGWKLARPPHTFRRIGAQTSNYFPRRRVEDQFLDALHNGLTAFEVFFDPQPEQQRGFNPEDLKDDFRRWLRDNSRDMDVHLSVHARRRHANAAERQNHWEQCLDFANDVGASVLVVDLPPLEFFGEFELDRFARDLQGLIEAASRVEMQVAVENGFCIDERGRLLLTTAEHLNAIFARLTSEGNTAGVSYNAGRAHLLEDPVAYLRKIFPSVTHIKLSDNHGPNSAEAHRRLGEGTLPLPQIVAELERRDYRGLMILEYFYADLRRELNMIDAAFASAVRERDQHHD